jgi:glycosyltransferase involved in cell wall biosynthesis
MMIQRTPPNFEKTEERQEDASLNEDVWIVIPNFNEGTVIGSVVEEVRKYFSNIVVVDDGSKDDSPERATQAGAVVIKHPINLGQGAALQTGIDFALASDCKFLATFDADGQHSTEDVLSMLKVMKATTNPALDVILGSRFLGDAPGIPRFRRIFLKAAALFTFFDTGIWLTDAHNGLRLFSASGARKVRIRQNRMAHASEVIALIRRHRLSFVEVPITIKYSEYSLAKGQRLGNAFNILAQLVLDKLGK